MECLTQDLSAPARRVAHLGTYTAYSGRRELSLVAVGDDLHVIDEGAGDAWLVEPAIEGRPEARALAADYLAQVSELGYGPLVMRPCEPTRGDGCAAGPAPPAPAGNGLPPSRQVSSDSSGGAEAGASSADGMPF